MDYRTVGKNRDISLERLVMSTLKAISEAGTKQDRSGGSTIKTGEEAALEKLMPTFTEKSPISPYKVAWELNNFK